MRISAAQKGCSPRGNPLMQDFACIRASSRQDMESGRERRHQGCGSCPQQVINVPCSCARPDQKEASFPKAAMQTALIHRREDILAHAARRTAPFIGYFFEWSAGHDARIRISRYRIINIATRAGIFFHALSPFLEGEKIACGLLRTNGNCSSENSFPRHRTGLHDSLWNDRVLLSKKSSLSKNRVLSISRSYKADDSRSRSGMISRALSGGGIV